MLGVLRLRGFTVENANTPVLLVTHSMGSIMTLYFLNQQSQAWKEKYIRSFVSIAGVWGGTARAVKVFAVGDNLDSWFLNEKNLLWERTNPSPRGRSSAPCPAGSRWSSSGREGGSPSRELELGLDHPQSGCPH